MNYQSKPLMVAPLPLVADVGAEPDVPNNSLLTAPERTTLAAHEKAIANSDFLTRWIAYCAKRTDAPLAFHMLNGYVLVATAIDRSRWLDLSHQRVYPSVYGLGLAGSGQRKTTSMRLAEDILMASVSQRVLANEYSSEGFLADIATYMTEKGEITTLRDYSRGTLFVDEAGRLLGMMHERSYAAGLKDLFAQAWDSPEEYKRRLRSTEYGLRSVYLSMVMFTTPSRFSAKVTTEDIASGFLARFLPVIVTEPFEHRPIQKLAPEVWQVRQDLVQWLQKTHKTIADNFGAMNITPAALDRRNVADGALMEWANAQYHEDLVQPWVQRLVDYIDRLALIFAVSEGAAQVDLVHTLRAISAVDRARDNALTVVEEIMKGTATRELDRIEKFILSHPGVSKRELSRRTHLPSGRLEGIIQELRSQERIIVKKDGKSIVYFPVPTSHDTNVTTELSHPPVAAPE